MNSAGRVVISAIVLLFIIPAVAPAQGRWGGWGRADSKEAVYRQGYDAGYRDGMRRGDYDYRYRSRPNYRTWEYDHGDRYYRWERYRGEYKKGYKKGYRDGYESAYRGHSNRRGHWWPF